MLVLLLALVFQTPTQNPGIRPPATVAERCGVAPDSVNHTIVSLKIDEQGQPREISVHKSSGNECIDQVALDAVKKYHFNPAKKNGKPVMVEMLIDVNVGKPTVTENPSPDLPSRL